MDVETHPNPTPNPYHRKVELQSPLDLAYLQGNLARSAHAKLDLHFPPSASQPAPATHIPLDGPTFSSQPSQQPQPPPPPPSQNHDAPTLDPMRARVQALVETFLAQTWEGAKHSISINGIDATSLSHPPSSHSSTEAQPAPAVGPVEGVDFAYTPYDHGLQKRVAALHAELEALTTQVSKLRRDAPQRAARMYGEGLGEAMQRDEQVFEGAAARTEQRGGEAGLELEPMAEGWQGEASATYERGLGELRRLGGMGGSGGGAEEGSLTETVGKVQRARVVAMELE